jgi:hypothetical protein
MRLATRRRALVFALIAALAVAVPAGGAIAQSSDDGASAAQRSKDPRDRGDKGGRTDPRCRAAERSIEIAQAGLASDKAALKRKQAKLRNAKAAAKEATGKQAKARAAKKVKSAKKAVKRAKKKVKQGKQSVADAKSRAKARGC